MPVKPVPSAIGGLVVEVDVAAAGSLVVMGEVKQVTTLPWHFTPKGALFGPIYGIYVG